MAPLDCPNRGCLAPFEGAIAVMAKKDAVRVDDFKRNGELQTLYIVSIDPFIISWQKVGQLECKHFKGDDAHRELNKIPSRSFFRGFKAMYARWERGKVW